MITCKESIKKSKELSSDLNEIILAFVRSNADMDHVELFKLVLMTLSLHIGDMLAKVKQSEELFEWVNEIIKKAMQYQCDCPECSGE